MPDVTLPSGLVKPAVSSTLYGPKWNANWDLMDGLFDRVALLETLHGGGIANYWPIPLGSTWAEAQAIITEAQAASGGLPGQIVVLPNEPINMTAGVDIITDPFSLIGSGPLSELIVDANTVIEGSNGVFNLNYVDGVELAYFKLTYDRTSLGGASRRTAFYVNWGSHNIDMHHLTINGCTSDVFHLACQYLSNNNEITNVRIWSNSATEWYESFCLLREGDIFNVKVFDNVGVTTTGHPNSSVSRPYGVGIDAESLYGLNEDITFENNNMDSTGVAGDGSHPGFGIFCAWSAGGTDSIDNARVNRVRFCHNTVAGFYYNGLMRLINRPWVNASFLLYDSNIATSNTGPSNLLFQPTDGNNAEPGWGEGDHLAILNHTPGDVTIDLSLVGGGGPWPGPLITHVDHP